ncbi:MAG: ribbon-helix-helix domain-containing protein [Thermoguttaceae bacterium]
MNSVTVNISFEDSLLRDIDRLAGAESRSRSELLREAARAYIDRKRRWAGIFALGRTVAERKHLSPEDVSREIRAYRKSKGKRR